VAGRRPSAELRRHGPLTIHELERLGENLFQACMFLDGRGVWHAIDRAFGQSPADAYLTTQREKQG
jgi:hypothetical protein